MGVAFYRAYRPNDLGEVVGQRHITDTLDKAFERGRVAHAYLLTGPRGVGKTSVARIIARRINGLPADHNIDQELDIIEIDAASNRGIDEMRALREKIATSPGHLQYKVFIIDEVHMLTREAFNALLKTLEEPPAHAVFVLATTESHKLPDTIISRTQRHDFRSITAGDITTHLSNVAKTESLVADPEALALIAERANGGFRDALSLLDMVASRGEEITVQLVAEMSGLGDPRQLDTILVLALAGDYTPAIQALNSQLQSGADPTIITDFLITRIRQAIIRPESIVNTPLSQLAPAQAIAVLQELIVAASQQRNTSIPSVPLELALWRLGTQAAPPPVAPLPKAPAAKAPSKLAPTKENLPDPVISNAPLNDSVITTKALSIIKTKNNSLYAILRSGEPHLKGSVLLISCRFRFHKERIEEAKNRQLIEAVLTKVAGRPIEMRVTHVEANETVGAKSSEELVASALEILGGEVIDG